MLVEVRHASAVVQGSAEPVEVVLPPGPGIFGGGWVRQVLNELNPGGAVVIPQPDLQVPAAAFVLHEDTQPLAGHALGDPGAAKRLVFFIEQLEIEVRVPFGRAVPPSNPRGGPFRIREARPNLCGAAREAAGQDEVEGFLTGSVDVSAGFGLHSCSWNGSSRSRMRTRSCCDSSVKPRCREAYAARPAGVST